MSRMVRSVCRRETHSPWRWPRLRWRWAVRSREARLRRSSTRWPTNWRRSTGTWTARHSSSWQASREPQRSRAARFSETGVRNDVRPLTASLSPSDGERVPVRAGEGKSAATGGVPSREGVHLDALQVVHAELEQGGVAVELKIRLQTGGVGILAQTVELLDREHIQGDGITAEPELVQGRRVVKQSPLAAFILANQRI